MTTSLGALEEAFRVDPTNTQTMAQLGRLYMEAQDWQKAQRVYRSMVLQNLAPSLGVSKADVYFNLGRVHAELGEEPKAKDMYSYMYIGFVIHGGTLKSWSNLK